MKNILCLLGIHEWKKVGRDRKIEDAREFVNSGTYYAYGECRRCGKREPRRAYGSWTGYHIESLDGALKRWEEEYEQWNS